MQNALLQTGLAIGNNITGPVIKKIEGLGILSDLVLGPVFEELVFRGGIQQPLVLGLETSLLLGGVNPSFAQITAQSISVALTAYLFAASHELFHRQSIASPGGSGRFIRAAVRGVIVENGTIYEAIGMHAINNLIFQVYARMNVIRALLEE